VVHILNRSPILAVQNKTPEEEWSGIKPYVAYFLVFGCLSYAHVPYSKRTTLDNKSSKYILLGINKDFEAYRLYDPLSQKMFISYDVLFNKDESWPWDDSHAEAIKASLDWSDINKDIKNNIQDRAKDNNSGGTSHEKGNGSISADNYGGFHEKNLEH